MADYSKMSTEDLEALKSGDLSKVSTEGLEALKGGGDEAPGVLEDIGRGAVRGPQGTAARYMSGLGALGTADLALTGQFDEPAFRAEMPTEESMRDYIEQKTVKVPKPETALGKITESATGFATDPASYAGPGGVLSKAGMAALTGAGSEALGLAADQYEIPGARTVGALATAPLASGAKAVGRMARGTETAAQKIAGMTPSVGNFGDVLINAAKGEAGYKSKIFERLEFKRQPFEDMLLPAIEQDWRGANIFALGGVADVANDVRSMLSPATITKVVGEGETVPFYYLNQVKQSLLENYAKSPKGTQRLAMQRAVDKIDEYMEKSAPPEYSKVLKDANANYRAGRLINEIRQSITEGIQRAEKSGVGANVYNNIRQQIDKLRLNPRTSRFLTPDEQAEIMKIAHGGKMGDFLNHIAKLGPDHPLSGWGTAIASDIMHGSGLSLAQLAVGAMAQGAAPKIVLAQVGDLEKRIFARTPHGASTGYKYEPPKSKTPALLSGAATRALRASPVMGNEDNSAENQ